MTTTPNRLEMPLFLVSRNSIRKNRIEELKSYIASKALQYTKKCIEDNAKISYQHKKLLNVIGASQPPRDTECINLMKRTAKRFRETPTGLPPNLYDTPKEPYFKWKGQPGAFWEQREVRSTKIAHDDNSKFYPTISMLDRLKLSCNAHKGKFLTDPRQRKPSSRFYIFDPSCCYRNPDDPGPANYMVNSHEIQHNLPKAKTLHPGKPYKFYPKTTCQAQERFDISNKATSSLSAPGRYEIRYARVRCRKPRLKYRPFLFFDIDREKRQKFRRKRWQRINRKMYCDPNMEHVIGGGFTRLFRMTRKELMEWKEMNDQKKGKKGKRFKKEESKTAAVKYADAHFLNLVNNTRFRVDNQRTVYATAPLQIKYVSILKLKIKKKAKPSKKVGFLCGAPRFDDLQRPPSLTKLQMRNIVNSLPENLRLINRPVMTKPIEEIKPRLYERKGDTSQLRRKAPLSLPPLPPTTLLFSEEALHVTRKKASKYFPPLELKHYFKEERKTP